MIIKMTLELLDENNNPQTIHIVEHDLSTPQGVACAYDSVNCIINNHSHLFKSTQSNVNEQLTA